MENLYNLSEPQKSILLTEQYYSGTSVNNIGGGIIVHSVLNFDLFKKAINNFVKYNDSFRIRLKQTKNGVKQYFEDYSEFDIDIIDLNNQSEVDELDKKILSKPINIFEEKLFEFTIFRFPNGHGGYTIKMHHIISDGWTSGFCCRKIMHEYSNLLNNEKTIFNNNYSYISYLETEKKYFSSEKFEKDKLYWEEKFKTIPNIVTIPSTMHNSSSDFSCEGNRLLFNISKKEVTKILNYCEKFSISLFNFFMAILSTYVYKINNVNDFVIGTPILNRSNVIQKNTSGMFINTAPLRINFENKKTFLELISAISIDSMRLLRHQKYPYQTIIENLRKKDSAIPNLYNILLSYQVTRSNKECDIPYDTRWNSSGAITDDFDLHLFDMDEKGSLDIAYDYKTSKYSFVDIQNIHDRLMHIIDQVIKNEEIEIKDIEIVTPTEKHKILVEFNNREIEYPTNKTIVDLLEEQVKKTPNNIALVCDDIELTYQELNEKSNQLAWFLKENGIEKNSVIGIRIDKKLELIVGILAIIKCDCCYLPINMSYPQERVDYMLKDSNARILLCTEASNKTLQTNITKLNIDLKNEKIYSNKKNNLPHLLTPEDLIYIIYTSGSTGTPKGAKICHRNVVRLFKNNKPLFDFNETDVWTMFHSSAFDFSVWEMYGALLFGGKLVLVKDEIAQDPNLFLNLLRKNNVTVLNQTPTYFYNLQRTELKKSDSSLNIRYIIFGGEALKPNLIKGWKLKYPNTKLINMYGITETTVHVTYKELSQADLNSPSSNIGTPIPTLQVVILDKDLNLVPLGNIGEMCVLGAGVFKGYLNRPELNNEKLVNFPLLNNELLYRSGDSAIMFEDGHLEYIGRIDNQVKLRGFRIELGEIEEKILENKKIEACIVTKKTDENNRDLLCAYYTTKSEINIDELKENLQKTLPNYMIPQYFIKIDKIPINFNGKTDFKALPLPHFSSIKKEIIPARNDVDNYIIEAFKSLLHIENIGINDSFFELGGDSLTAISICSILNNRLKTNISVKDILTNPVIIDLSDYITKNNAQEQSIQKVKPKEFYLTSSVQKRMYYATKANSEESVLYNIPGALVFDTLPDIEKLKYCIELLFERHESLRTYFELENDEIVQKIAPNINFKLEVQNSTSENTDYLLKQFIKPFNLSKAPLFRCTLVIQPNNKATLLIDMHHSISDGTSVNILLEELSKLYNGQKLSEIELTYKDFSEWENSYYLTNKFKESENFWLEKFSDELPILNMPTTFTRPLTQSFEGNSIDFEIDKKLKNKIEKISKELNITPYMFLLACYYILLYKYTNQDNIIVGTPISERTLPEISNIVGMFVNTLPLKMDIKSSISFKTFLNSVKEMCLDSFEYQDYPFDFLVKKLNLQRNSNRNLIFDTMFIFQNSGLPTLKLKNINSKFIEAKHNTSKYDFSLEIRQLQTSLNLKFEYCTKLFNEKFIIDLANRYLQIIRTVTEDITTKICNIQIISDEEKNNILYDFNNTNMPYDKNKNIQTIFEENVEKNLDKTAIIFENTSITYKELNEKANQVANYLLTNNIKSNCIVGIMLNRSIETIICMLGILKAGGAYMLIDYNLPNERIEYMLKNANTSLLITSSNLKGINFDNIFIYKQTDLQYYNTVNPIIDSKITDNLSIVYTSGSTGVPKGVLLHRQGMINLMENYKKLLNTSSYNNYLSTCSISFDMFAVEIFIPLYNGKTLILANEEETKIPTLLSDLISNNKVEFMLITPSKLQLLLTDNEIATCLSNLKSIQLGGEKLSSQLYNKITSYTSANIFNQYGPSEITACCCLQKVGKKFNIGKPNYNTQIYILNKDLNLCPPGIEGEICISGDGVSKGYINNPEITKKAFIKNPYGNGILYKSGDIGKWTTTGEIEYIGRKDFQIKIRGLRIELSEIENKLLEIPQIDNVAVILKQSDTEDDYLVGFFTSNSDINISNIRQNLLKALPLYMIPKYIIKLDKMPITINGKINKRELSSLKINKKRNQLYVAPENDLQKLLCDTWESFLHTKLGIDDNIFEAGVDSLIAIKFKTALLSHNLNIPYANLFKYPTVRSLSENTDLEEIISTIGKYDYTNINKILAKNNFDTLKSEIKHNSNNNILLLGSNGYVGSHILYNFIKQDTGKAYCIIREKHHKSAESRFMYTLHFYFGDELDSLINDRIFILQGDITEKNFGLSQEIYDNVTKQISTVINSAAMVKHYGKIEKFKNINIYATGNLCDYCKKYHKKLLHISTMSVSENSNIDSTYVATKKFKEAKFAENNLYIGQVLDNEYTYSKFKAERIILKNIPDGLNAKIIRLGNITNRFSDGKFQINSKSNAFASRLRSFSNLKCIPDYLQALPLEFTPVDLCSKAIVYILQNNIKDFSVFHLYNSNYIYLKDLVELLNINNIKLDFVEQKKFKTVIKKFLNSRETQKKLSGIINDLNPQYELIYEKDVELSSKLTELFLERVGFKWPKIDESYIQKYIDYMKKINFFKEEQ